MYDYFKSLSKEELLKEEQRFFLIILVEPYNLKKSTTLILQLYKNNLNNRFLVKTE
jgi:hypothetical protein